jgi:hypothetical protein
MLVHCIVSGHGVQIKDTNGDEGDGLDECSLMCLLGGTPVTDGILLGICAMDYLGILPNLNANTPGLIVDDVSHNEQLRNYFKLPICTL